MKTLAATLSAIGALVLSVLGLQGTNVPVADFSVSPPNPAVGQTVQFVESSTGSPTLWTWDFGDGGGSAEHNPTHAYAAPGAYVVTLTAYNTHGSGQKVRDVLVGPGDSLRLNAAGGHSFLATVQGHNLRTGETGPGLAIPQTDVFGFFSLPALTRNPDNPEVFVKLVDGSFLNGHFWVFYGGLTSLEYTLTVEDELTGETKSYFKPSGSAEGGFDTSAFAGSPAGSTAAWLSAQAGADSWRSGFAPAAPASLRPKVQVEIQVVPANPVADQLTQLSLQNLPLGPHEIEWTLLPGVVVIEPKPVYRFPTAGRYTISAFDRIAGGRYVHDLEVSASDVVRLLPADDAEFEVSLAARDGHDRTAFGDAHAVNDLVGTFSLKDFTGNPNNAEVVAKVLDGRGVNNHFWVFDGGLTSVQWTLKVRSLDFGVSKYYFKDLDSKFGVFDTSGFDPARQPTISSFSPLSGPDGTTIRILGTHLYGDLMEPFFDDSIGHLKNRKFPLHVLRGGVDLPTGLDFVEVEPTNPFSTPLTGPIVLPLSLSVDHYLAIAPQSFTLLPGSVTPTPVPTLTATSTTPVPTPTHAASTQTPTLPAPTATVTQIHNPTVTPTSPPGAPVVQSTTTDDVSDGSIFDIEGMNLGACNVVAVTFEGSRGVFALICQFGDGQSIQVQVPLGGLIPVGDYNACVTRKGSKGCSSFQMHKH